MRIVVSLGLALLATPAFAQTLMPGGGWVFGPTEQQSGPIIGNLILTPQGTSIIHRNGDGGATIFNEDGSVGFLVPGSHLILE